MVGIRTVAFIVGIVLIQTSATEEENDLHAKFSKLETKVTVLTERLKQEEKKVSGLQMQMELLKKQQANVTELLSDSKKGPFEDIVGKFQGHDIREYLAPNRRHSRSSDPTEVAFTAELTNELTNVPLHTTIKFDTLVYRTDDFYDNSTGVFTCPTPGLYLFAVFIEPHLTDVESEVSLFMDGKSYMSAISEISYGGQDNMGGNLVLLQVNKGQRVWVETSEVDNQSFWKDFTTFSGVLIHRN